MASTAVHFAECSGNILNGMEKHERNQKLPPASSMGSTNTNKDLDPSENNSMTLFMILFVLLVNKVAPASRTRTIAIPSVATLFVQSTLCIQ